MKIFIHEETRKDTKVFCTNSYEAFPGDPRACRIFLSVPSCEFVDAF
jgi:hypothetical protein